jgi:cell division protein FtsW
VDRRLKRIQKNTKKPESGHVDKTFFFLTIGLTVAGLVAVADSSAPTALSTFHDPYYFFKQQLVWAGIGFVCMICAIFINYKHWKKVAVYIFGVSIFFLILVLLPGFGSKVLGARRWLYFGPVGFQPAEIVKLTLAIFIAYLFSEKKHYYYAIGAMGLVAGLIMLQPDFGTTLVLIGIGVVQVFVAGIPILVFLGLGGFGIISAALLILTSTYRRQRLMTFLEMSSDPQGSSYHISQILIAIGSGGFFGVGLGKSRQKHLFLPETATDSVFAIIAEEIGFFGATILIVILFYYVFRAYRIALNAPDDFSKLLGVGIATWLGVQTILNLSSMVALTPLTGIPLPFFSYGGSSLTMILFSVGILLNISKHREI